MEFDPLRRSTDRPADDNHSLATPAPSVTASDAGRERRQKRRERRLHSADDLLRQIEPVFLILVFVDALAQLLSGAIQAGAGQLAGIAALGLSFAWASRDALQRRGASQKKVARLVRAVILALTLPWFMDSAPLFAGVPGTWLWLVGAVLVYPVALSATWATLFSLLAAVHGELMISAFHPEMQGLEVFSRIIALMAFGQLSYRFGRSINASGSAMRGMRIGEQRARAIIDSLDVMMLLVNRRYEILQVNHAVESVLGYNVVQFKRIWNSTLLHPADRARFLGECRALWRHPGDSSVVTTRVRRADGSWASVEVRMTNLLDNPAVNGIFASVADITARVAAEQRLQYQASHDSLTGLYNRRYFTDRLAAAITEARSTGKSLTLFFCDLDFFKSINDRYGHETGDRFLKVLSGQLSKLCDEPGDIGGSEDGAGGGTHSVRLLSRFGGDEFVLLAPHSRGEDLMPLGERLLRILSAPVRVGPLGLQVEASIGMAQLRPEHDGPEALIRDADAAMYQAKETGRNRVARFDDGLRRRVLRRAELAQGLRGALERDELNLAWQPKVDLRSGKLSGFEVLIRWDSAEFGSISPNEFIPIAEESGHIVQIGLWALNAACRQLALWQRDYPGMRHLTVAVNVSMRQLIRESFVADALQVIDDAHIIPGTLELEVTESAAMVNPEQTITVLQTLKDSGLRLALDDFGTGYSSLAWLRRLPVDVLKIDRAFVHGIQSAADDAEIVKLVIALAQVLGIQCVAEGIESEASARELRRLGCDYGQGYYFAQPLTVAQAQDFFERGFEVS